MAAQREVVQRLAHLAATRSRLLDAQTSIGTPLKEKKAFVHKRVLSQEAQLCKGTLGAIAADLKKTEQAIDTVIESDPELKRLFALVTSVTGIGSVTATQIIVSTNEFRDIKDPKKFACYSGVAPFTRESGMYKGRAKVSHMANKKVKELLHMAAIVAIVYNSDMKRYYERKVNEEGKNKMSVINAVRSKLVLRVFACVNQNRKYDKIYTNALA